MVITKVHVKLIIYVRLYLRNIWHKLLSSHIHTTLVRRNRSRNCKPWCTS